MRLVATSSGQNKFKLLCLAYQLPVLLVAEKINCKVKENSISSSLTDSVFRYTQAHVPSLPQPQYGVQGSKSILMGGRA